MTKHRYKTQIEALYIRIEGLEDALREKDKEINERFIKLEKKRSEQI